MITNAPFNASEVLVVDDDPLSRQMLVMMLQSADIRAESADDGQDAIEIIARRGPAPFEAVITDVQMPRMGGLALLAWLNQHAPTTATVIMTANQERELVSASLRGGAVEFLDKPFEMRTVLRAARKARESHLRRTRQLAAAHRLLDISDINQRLTRTALVSGGRTLANLSLATRFYALNEAGGDLVKATALDQDRILLVLGDVSGHGLKEGFLSAYFQGIIEGMARHDATARGIAEAFNRFLQEQWNDSDPLAVNTSLSACFIELNLRARTISILNCGGPGVLLADGDGAVRLLAPGGSPLGWFPRIEPVELTTSIDTHGQLCLWSDGLEAHAATLQIPPLALAYRILGSPANSLAANLLHGADDDIVACRLDWTPPPPSEPGAAIRVPLHQAAYRGDEAGRIDQLQAAWARLLSISLPHLGSATLHDIVLCLREALLNALEHGCQNSPALHARLEILVDASARLLLVRLANDGPGFDPLSRPPTSLLDHDHISLGLDLIRALARSVNHSADGRTIEMTFNLPAPPAS